MKLKFKKEAQITKTESGKKYFYSIWDEYCQNDFGSIEYLQDCYFLVSDSSVWEIDELKQIVKFMEKLNKNK